LRLVELPNQIQRNVSEKLGFVPTMGALHAGHLSLIERAKSENDRVAVSIFVNPKQFGPREDFHRYPRPLEADLALCEKAGVDVVFHPSVETMYVNCPTSISVPELGDRYEGTFRPGHFDGVATVVLKLLNIVSPTTAYFGLKDLQQCSILAKMVQDLNVNVKLRFLETLREGDGLAMSSRNRFLSAEERTLAPIVFQELREFSTLMKNGGDSAKLLIKTQARIENSGFVVDYVDYIARTTFTPISELSIDGAIIFAGRIGTTRLIDNVLILV